MTKILNIPYRSQEDDDAKKAYTDCGAACVAMIVESFGTRETIDNIFASTGREPREFLSRSDLINAANNYNVSMKKFGDGSFEKLKSALEANLPMIALINYAAWSQNNIGVPTQSTFDKTHFVVVVGYDDNDNIIIHDPLWWGTQREGGNKKTMTYAQFNAAWSTCNEYRNNPNNVGIISNKALTGSQPPPPPPPTPVTDEEIILIRAWAEYTDMPIEDPSILKQREVADVYLHFVGDWGKHTVTHKVEEGDDLGLIALRYYDDPLKWKVITIYNDLPPINAFKVGDVFRIPEPTRP